MNSERDPRTTELTLGTMLTANGGEALAPLIAAVHGEEGGDALELHGEYGRIRMLQDRLDEAERLRSAIHRASKLRTRGYAKLAVKYADILHRLHRDDEAIDLLDRIEPVLRKYPVTLNDHAAVAAKLRSAMKVHCPSSDDGLVPLNCR